MKTAIILINCPDKKGIVATISNFIFKNEGNILYLDQHVDVESGTFFMRIELDLENFNIPYERIEKEIRELGKNYRMTLRIYRSWVRPRMAIFVSRLPHCLDDILARHRSGELEVDIPLVISNHEDLRHSVEAFGIEFYYIPKTPETRAEQERAELKLLKDKWVDFIVLARYMQILSPAFLSDYTNKIINIHHSFLPAFPGAKPYHSAFKRGVKVIGASSHYVTSELDAGPIIEQDVTRVTHRDSVADMVRKGRDLEKIVLSRGVHAHLTRKVLVYENKTVIFS